MQFPRLTETSTSTDWTDVFRGYNHCDRISDGEWYDEENLTSSGYPVASTRPRRMVIPAGFGPEAASRPNGMIAKDALLYIRGDTVFYNGEDITPRLPAGFTLSAGEKTLVSMGAYVLIWPDKVYINTADWADSGYMEHTTATGESDIAYTICKRDGSTYGSVASGSTEPENPANGDVWLDTSGEVHGLKQYSAATGMWVSVAATYVMISSPGIGKGFSEGDGIRISGASVGTVEGEDTQGLGGTALIGQIEALNGSHVIESVGEDHIIITGVLDRTYTQTWANTASEVILSRRVPDMDFVTEAQNRVWGCKYGVVDGETVNTLYCCALGDFKNWERFSGISTDSWFGNVGSDGQWTGAATHLGYPIFFKENCLHKIYISSQGAHQVVETQCRGIQKGSHKSAAVVNEVLYYKARTAVMAYDGSLPVEVSAALGAQRYSGAVAGSYGNKYYISMQDDAQAWHLFVYDTVRGQWHRESSGETACFARVDDELYCVMDDQLLGMNGVGLNGLGEMEQTVVWSATTGYIGYETHDRKYLSRFNLRVQMPKESVLEVWCQYDNSDQWIHQATIRGAGNRTFMIPVRPRRCDRMRIRLTGTGEAALFSIGRIREIGSDVSHDGI